MKLFLLTFTLLSILLSIGCDTLNHRQYLLVHNISKDELHKLRSDLEEVLSPVVLKHDLIDARSDARTKGVILYYKTKNNFPIIIGMKVTESGPILDVMHFHSGIGESEDYLNIVKDVKDALKKLNNYNLVELKYGSHIQ